MTKVINTINDDILSENICFIPTMGAIHEGHLSLVEIGKETNLKTLVSIFLNRRQFNNDEDFKNYPTELEQDIQFLKSRGVDFIFLPQESYKQGNVNRCQKTRHLLRRSFSLFH